MQVEIDFAYQEAGLILISGWLASESELDMGLISFSPLANSDPSNFVLHSRKDVCDVLNIAAQHCSGFVALLDTSNQQKQTISVHYNEQADEFNVNSLSFVDELKEVKSLAPDYEEQLMSLLSRNGFSLASQNIIASETSSLSAAFFDYCIGDTRIHFEECVLLDEKTVLLLGWILQQDASVQNLRCVVNNVQSDDILTTSVRFSRADVIEELRLVDGMNNQLGILVTIVSEQKVVGDVSLTWNDSTNVQHCVPLPIKSFSKNEIAFTRQMLSNLNIQNKSEHAKLITNVLPALTSVWSKRLGVDQDWDERCFGEVTSDPKLSLIIPIYGRYDFVQHQMAQFSIDPEFSRYEVIYVLDDPRITHEFLVTCYGVYETFRSPFRIILSAKNLGFSGANNLGFRFVQAPLVLFMNSDVMPIKPGWASQLIAQYTSTQNIGILGATLLYEDETVQHRGMEFCQDPSHDGLWMNYHPQKGFPLSMCDQFDMRKFDCVTGACMLISKQLFEDIHGFDKSYILGDFEDSDLCLRLIQAGYDVYVSGDVALYHLERLSQNMGTPTKWKQNLSLLNGLRHTVRWNDVIAQLVSAKHV